LAQCGCDGYWFRTSPPSEAGELSKVIDSYARVLQSVEFEARLTKLEQATEK
jgi:hypothetical protein